MAPFPSSWLTGVASELVSLMLWTLVSSFVPVPLVPGLTVTVGGVNWKVAILTGASPGAVARAPWFFLVSPLPQPPAVRATAGARMAGPARVIERVMPGVRIGLRLWMTVSCLWPPSAGNVSVVGEEETLEEAVKGIAAGIVGK